MYTPSNFERETILRYDQTPGEASLYSCDPALKRKLRAFAEKHPDLCRLMSQSDIAETYTINKKSVAIRLKEPLTEEQKALARERALSRGLGFKKKEEQE